MKRALLLAMLTLHGAAWGQPADRTVMNSRNLPSVEEDEGAAPTAHDQSRAAIFNQMILAQRQQEEGTQLKFVLQESAKPWCLAGLLGVMALGLGLGRRKRPRVSA